METKRVRAAKFAEIAIEYNYSIFDEYLINIRGCRSAAGLNGYRRPHQKLKAGWYLSFQSMFLNLCSIYVSNFLSDYIADRLAFPKKITTFVPLEPAKPLYNAQIGGSFFIIHT